MDYTYIIYSIWVAPNKGRCMRKVPITITLPESLIRDLHLYIPERGISGFVSNLVEKGLEEKKNSVAQEYREAAADEERNREAAEWDVFIGDGLDGTNEYKTR